MRKRQDAERIYGTALELFARYGYKKTTLEDIASALDMSNTNLYSYAKSKRALYNDTVAWAIDQWQESVRQAVKEVDDPKERLLTAFKAAVSYIDGNPETQGLLRNDPTFFPMFPTVDPIEEYNDWSMNFLRGILQDGVDRGEFKEIDVDAAATIMFNLYKYFIVSTYEADAEAVENLTDHLDAIADLLFHGLLH